MNRQYKFIWSQKRSLFNVEAHIRQYIDHRNILGSTHNHSFLYAKDNVAEEFHLLDDNYNWIKLSNKFLRKKYFENFLNEGKLLRKDFDDFIKLINKIDLDKISTDELINMFEKSCYFHSRLRGYFKALRGEFLASAEIRLLQILKTKYTKQKVTNLFVLLTTPSQFDDTDKQTIDWFFLLLKNIEINIKIILDHLCKYPWLIAHSNNVDEFINYYFDKFEKDRKNLEHLFSNVVNLLDQKIALKKMQKLILNKFNNEEFNYLSKLFQEAAVERMRLKGGWAGSDYLYLPLFEEIAKRTNINIEDLYSSYRIDEIIKALKNQNTILSKSEIQNRKKTFVFILNKRKLTFYSGDKADKIIKRQIKNIIKENIDTITINGQPASLGKAQGKVKIITPGNFKMLRYDLKHFKDGDVLVSSMTQPNMVPIMKKAAAIVTNEGGLTSHAAIIAREFKIPCIVGCEIATKVFKNGDLIEVDANKGIVKKL